MIIKILFILFNIWYWIGEAATEGFTWASKVRRTMNILIRPGIHDDKNWKDGKGFMCYHSWRVFGENIGILGMIIFAFLLIGISWGTYLLLVAGATLVSVFIYERVFNYISYDKLFPQKVSWDILNGMIKIPRAPWQDWIFLVIGTILIIFGLT